MRIKNDIKQPKFFRDYYWLAVRAVDQRLGRVLSVLKAFLTTTSRPAFLETIVKPKCNQHLSRNTNQNQTNGYLASNNKFVLEAKLLELEQANQRLLEEKDQAQKAQLQSQSQLAQVAGELTPTLNELGGLAHVSAEHWRNDFDNRDGNEFADRLEFTSQHVLSIVQDFADLAKLKTDDITLNPQEIDPNELIKDVASSVQGVADRLLVELQFEPNVRKILIFGDLNRLRQMLVRALLGAIDCAGENGFVKISPVLNSFNQLCFWLELGGGKKALMYQRLSVEHKEICGQKLTSNWGCELVARLAELHGGNLGVSQDDFGTQTWEMKLPKTRVTVLAANN